MFSTKSKRVVWLLLAAALAAAAVLGARGALQGFRRSQPAVPTVRVERGEVTLQVHATGALAASRSALIMAPAIGGGTLRITHLLKTGTPVKAGDVVVEFDPTEQQYSLEQSRTELEQAQQETVKAKADSAVQTAEDQVALLKAQFDVRRAELEVSKNELVSAIDAKKNLAALAEAKRALAQLTSDVQSHAASNQATLAVNQEKERKAQLGMQEAERNIQQMRVTAPFDGLVEVKSNPWAYGGVIFGGMPVPEFREGDAANPGAPVAETVAPQQMEIRAKVGEADRANISGGQPAEVTVDALPGKTFAARVEAIAGLASRGNFWQPGAASQFDLTIALEQSDSELRPGYTASVTISGRPLSNVLYLPSQAVFERSGQPVVYVKSGSDFQAHPVQVKVRTESRVVVEGLAAGTEVALVDPTAAGHLPGQSPSAPPGPGGPSLGGGGR
jgi:HlyD family secretion protein